MTALCLRLLALFALVLMPFGMPAAAAGAAAPRAEAGHCAGQHNEQSPEPVDVQMHCMSCAGLPAFTPAMVDPALAPRPARIQSSVPAIRGIELEIATPPPKIV